MSTDHGPVRKLNPLLRLAAVSGVETAIRLHIRRGDDLDARDSYGATPLILAAGRRKSGVVRLLLEAGADPMLADLNGMDALAHARAGGCPETIAVLTVAVASSTTPKAACEPVTEVTEPAEDAFERVPEAQSEIVFHVAEFQDGEAAPMLEGAGEVHSPPGERSRTTPVEPALSSVEISSGQSTDTRSSEKPDILILDEEQSCDLLIDDWEAEEETVVPEGDDTVADAVRHVHESIGRHKAVDRDEDWTDVDLHLPVRAVSLARGEDDGPVRSFLLAALREGLVSEERLVDVCSNADGSHNEEAERLLAFVVEQLGATVVEWTGWDEERFLLDASMEEDLVITEAVEFANEIASGHNDPFRYFAKCIRGELLSAEEEIALSREMEEAGREALSALASWPEGLSVVFDAADRVATGDADAESFTAGHEPSSDEHTVSTLDAAAMEHEDNETGLDAEAAFFVNAIAAVKASQGDARKVAEALEEARLTRGFLMDLADKAGAGQGGGNFAEALARQAKAREHMIISNLRLALAIARKHLWSGIPFDDLVQEANIGLMKAVERYDWRRGYRFSTYATWWIRQRVSRAIADTGRVVRAPVHIQEAARKVLRERESVEACLGRPETEAETARRIGMSIRRTRMLLSMFEDVVSLDEIDPDSGMPKTDGLVDEGTTGPDDLAERASLRRILVRMLDQMGERTREVILLRFGFADEMPMTLEEVGLHFGVTRERIRQIESKAMRKFAHPDKRQILCYFMGDGYVPPRAPSSEAETTGKTVSENAGMSAVEEISETPLPVGCPQGSGLRETRKDQFAR